MKKLIASLFILSTTAAFACHDQHFGLALNQRSFYNPAALCPYCKGSSFMSTGLSFMPGVKNNSGFYYAFGNDAENFVHGPWDFSWSQLRSADVSTKAFSVRYAFAFNVRNWRVAIGVRGSHYKIHDEGDAQFSTKLFDGDAGFMATNQKGFYIGASLNHLGSPSRTIRNENGITYAVSLPQSINVMSGYVQKLNTKWDVLPDISLMTNVNESVFEPGAMVRYNHHYALGGGMTFATDEKATYEIRAGYMSSKFKFLASACPTAEGWTLEGGITWRFWFTQDCDGGTCSVKHPFRKLDDFVKHR
jgi:hypothetical protein